MLKMGYINLACRRAPFPNESGTGQLTRELWNDVYPGVPRGTGGPHEIRLDATSDEAKLALHLDRDDYKTYDITLADTPWRQGDVRSEHSAAGPLLRVKVPGALLAPGREYTLVVSPAKSMEAIRAYVFSVDPRPAE